MAYSPGGGLTVTGGTDNPPSVTSPGSPSPSPAKYRLWGTATSDAGLSRRLVIVDPRQPEHPLHSLLLTDVEGKPAVAVPVTATRIDPANGRVTALGQPRLYFLQEGKVLTQDLGIESIAEPRRLSTVDNACTIDSVHPLTAAAEESWALVTTGGPDRACGTTADNTRALVRNSMAADEPAVTLGIHGSLIPLVDAAGTALAFLANSNSGLRRYTADLTRYTQVSSFGGSLIGSFPAQRRLFLRSNGLQVLDYSGPPSIGPSLLEIPALSSFDSAGGGEAAYFSVGRSLYRVTADGRNALIKTFELGEVWRIMPAANHVVVMLSGDSTVGYQHIWSIPRNGGEPLDLQVPVRDVGSSQYVQHLYATAGDSYFYLTHGGSGTGVLWSVNADGSGKRQLAAPARHVGILWQPGLNASQQPEVAALLFCQPQAGHSDCDGAPLMQLDVPSGQTTQLGTLPGTGSASRSWQLLSAQGLITSPFMLQATLVDRSQETTRQIVDLFQADPRIAGSLRRVTANALAP